MYKLVINECKYAAATPSTMSKDASASADSKSVLGPIASSLCEELSPIYSYFIAKKLQNFNRLVTKFSSGLLSKRLQLLDTHRSCNKVLADDFHLQEDNTF